MTLPPTERLPNYGGMFLSVLVFGTWTAYLLELFTFERAVVLMLMWVAFGVAAAMKDRR